MTDHRNGETGSSAPDNDAAAGRRAAPADRTVPDVSPELPAHHWRLILDLLQRLPQAALSRGFGQIADVRVPVRLRPMVLGGFARMVGIDLDEAEKTLDEYDCINDLFVRRLRSGARNWPADDAAITSPVDGVLGRSGAIQDGLLIQAKGRHYTAAALLLDDDAPRRYENGSFVTIYLSPRHYHRIHAPHGGSIAEARHLPGALLPVNAAGVMHVPDLFPRNERVVCSIDGTGGRTAVVAVGAYNVGRISTAFDTAWLTEDGRAVTNRFNNTPEIRRYDAPPVITRGDEIMAFHLGSTIVMLFEHGVRLAKDLEPGREVRLGSPIARLPA